MAHHSSLVWGPGALAMASGSGHRSFAWMAVLMGPWTLKDLGHGDEASPSKGCLFWYKTRHEIMDKCTNVCTYVCVCVCVCVCVYVCMCMIYEDIVIYDYDYMHTHTLCTRLLWATLGYTNV